MRYSEGNSIHSEKITMQRLQKDYSEPQPMNVTPIMLIQQESKQAMQGLPLREKKLKSKVHANEDVQMPTQFSSLLFQKD